MKPTPLSTERLILRRSNNRDAIHLYNNYTSDPVCSIFLTRPPHSQVDQTAEFLKKWCQDSWENESNQFAWVVSLAENDEAIGLVIVMVEGHKAQIHFGLGQKFWQQGFATEFGHLVVQWLMTKPDIQRVWTVCDLDNHASIKILEKLGFKNEGILQKWLVLPAFGNIARDCHIYSKTW